MINVAIYLMIRRRKETHEPVSRIKPYKGDTERVSVRKGTRFRELQ
jgi:hypothetical protein